jgi:hypothetical protein
MREEQRAINELRLKLEADRQRVAQQEADNWRETAVIRSRQKELENEVAVVERDRGILVKRAQQLELQEDQRRRNRFVILLNHDRTLENDDCDRRTLSEAYIEDSFATLSPRSVVENLTYVKADPLRFSRRSFNFVQYRHPSDRIRKHAMNNISTCIGGNKNPPPSIVQFTPPDIAPDLLPKLHQLVSSSAKPVESVLRFAEETVSAPPMARALAIRWAVSTIS